jgi:hypothetical protein
MYYSDHLPPHFHARYSGQEVEVRIDSLTVLQGDLPPRVLGLVFEWASRHRDELRANWELARQGRPLRPIDPLD